MKTYAFRAYVDGAHAVKLSNTGWEVKQLLSHFRFFIWMALKWPFICGTADVPLRTTHLFSPLTKHLSENVAAWKRVFLLIYSDLTESDKCNLIAVPYSRKRIVIIFNSSKMTFSRLIRNTRF